jgi:hypothetical protein
MNIDELLYYSSPAYTKAFEDGYEYAKREILEKIKSMKALTETSATVSAEAQSNGE